MGRKLEVWLYNVHVGSLRQTDGRLAFSYSQEWLDSADAYPLSQSLPLQGKTFNDRESRPFFAGLLPEGDKRKKIARALQASEENDFALLDGIGGECAGAVSLLELGQLPPPADRSHQVRWLNDSELSALLEELPRRPMLAGEEGLRLSLAGAQDKLPVFVQKDKVGLPLSNTPSSHILKPEVGLLQGTVFNEGFCMHLAAGLKIDAAKAAIKQVDGKMYLLVQRYDRRLSGDGRLQRLHQEDFCQALAIAPEYKYQNEGGPDLAGCFNLLRAATRPSAPHVLRFFDYVVFNTLIGNQDAHAKNFSLLYPRGGPVLAPTYDVLSTAVYPELTNKMAMQIGGKYRFRDIYLRHWNRFAESTGLSPAQAKKRVLEIAKKLPVHAHELKEDFQMRGLDHPVLGEIIQIIQDRCEQTIRRITGRPG